MEQKLCGTIGGVKVGTSLRESGKSKSNVESELTLSLFKAMAGLIKIARSG